MKTHLVTPDGNCLFRALSFCLFGFEEHHPDIRHRCVHHVLRHWDSYKNFIIGDESFGAKISTPEDYGRHMGADGTYGGHVEITAAVDIFNLTIVVIDSATNYSHEFGSGRRGKVCSLLFSGSQDKGHFDVIL
ncbi:OTU domain-containing protein 1-like [Cimex lectularius]|uniref:OTU domain-containing protein n=1 Tax=Cimex lectularius TaxID=79782 RepID=A0A8I6S5G9_CIMLE|nr:OTU domain-containing protein 1-like [Cimex lectularius]